MKQRINYTQENSSPIVRLKEENAVLRAQLSSLKEKYDTILEERRLPQTYRKNYIEGSVHRYEYKSDPIENIFAGV